MTALSEGSLVAIVQARMSSTRLPGKVLLPFAGKTVIETQIDRIWESHAVGRLIVAISTEPSDDILAEKLEQTQCEVFRGPLDDVFGRFVGALSGASEELVLRLTGDCPLTCPRLIDEIYSISTQGNFDFVSNSHQSGTIRGFDLELVRLSVFREAVDRNLTAYEREHVMPVFYSDSRIKRHLMTYPDLQKFHTLNLSLDTDSDFKRLNDLEERHGVSKLEFESIVPLLEDLDSQA